MTPQQKALHKREYKEQTTRHGVFRLHDPATGTSWVDASTTLDTIENRIRFDLRMGTHRNRPLQQAWTEGDPDALQFEILEVFPVDATGYTLENLMKDRKAHWMRELDASSCQ